MGAFVNGADRAIEENRQKTLDNDRMRYAEATAIDELLAVLREDVIYLREQGLQIEKDGAGSISIVKKEVGEHVARFKWSNNSYLAEIFGLTKNFETAEKAVEELGYALQIRSSGGAYGLVKLWD